MIGLIAALALAEPALDTGVRGTDCGPVQATFPASGARDIRTDTAPRFLMDGYCLDETALDFVQLTDDTGTVVETSLQFEQWQNATVVVATPSVPLSPESAYVVTVTPEFASQVQFDFQTGTDDMATRQGVDTVAAEATAECGGREGQFNGLTLQFTTFDDGFVGLLTDDPGVPQFTTVRALDPRNGQASTWLGNLPVEDGQVCASYATYSGAGALTPWEEVCADVVMDLDCTDERGCGGCGGDNLLPGSRALLLLPFIPLLLRRRRANHQ